MTPKYPERISQWRFDVKSPTGESFSIVEGTRQRAIEKIIRQFEQFDSQFPEWSKASRQEAQSLGMDWREYLQACLDNQQCKRMGGLNSGECWGGKGDRIHAFMENVDSFVAKAPKPVQKLGKAITRLATLAATGKSSSTFGGCRTCGGSRRFDGGKNLGRAAKIQ